MYEKMTVDELQAESNRLAEEIQERKEERRKIDRTIDRKLQERELLDKGAKRVARKLAPNGITSGLKLGKM